MEVKVDKFGRLDPTTMTFAERRAYTLNRIHWNIDPVYAPIVQTTEPLSSWLTLDKPTLFEEIMIHGGKTKIEYEKVMNKLNLAVSIMKEAAEMIPEGTRYDKTFDSVIEAIKGINGVVIPYYPSEREGK